MTRPMTLLKSLTLTSFAALALTAGAALAGDLSNGAPGGLKDGRGAAVPVPVPVPYEETYKYYIGLGAGWTFNSSGNMAVTADHQMSGQPANWVDSYSKLQGPHVVSIVAGRYITPSLRAELGYDYRAPQRAARATNVIVYNGQVSGTVGAAQQTNVYAMARTEDVVVQNQTFMLNAYYDLTRAGRIRPYIGAGIGFTRRDATRTSAEAVGACIDAQSTGGACQYNGTTLVNETGGSRSSYEESVGFGFAASLMAGASYSLSERTHLDLGYRMMYQGGKLAVVSPSLGGFSSLEVGARLDHEIRTGLRFDIW